MNVAGNNTPFHISANTAGVQVRAGNGQLHTVTINTKGGSSNLLTLYDGTSTGGTVIAAIDTTSAVGTLKYDVQFLAGLFAVLATGTEADITITVTS